MKTHFRRCGNVDWKVASLLGCLSLTYPCSALDYFWNFGTNGVWSDATRWGPLNQVPNGAGNTVEISVPTAVGHSGGPIYGVTVDGTYAIDGFTHIAPTGNFLSTGRTFTVNGPTLFDGYQITLNTSNYVSNGVFTHGSGHLDLVSSTLSGTGSYDKNGGTLNLTNSSINIAGSQSAGSMTLFDTNTFGDDFLNTSGTVTVDNDSTVNLNSGDFTNAGTVQVQGGNASTFFKTNSNQTLTNAAGGIFNVNGGGTAKRFFQVNISNAGTFNLNEDTEWERSGAVYSNSGTINQNADLLVQFGQSFSNLSGGNFNSTTGILDIMGNSNVASTFENAGTITLSDGAHVSRFNSLSNTGQFNVNGGTAHFRTGFTNFPYFFINSGDIEVAPGAVATFSREGSVGVNGNLVMESGSTLKGGGDINLINQTTDIQGSLDIEDSSLTATTSSINGAGTLTVGPSGELDSINSNWGTTVETSGTSSFSGTLNTAYGSFSNKAGGNLTIEEGTQIRLDDENFINEGNFFFAPGSGQTYFREINTGSLGSFVNTPSGVVTVDGSGIRRFNNSVDNQGLINLNTITEFDNSGGIHFNSGTLNANSNLLVQTAESFTNQVGGNLNSTTGILDLTGNSSVTSTFANAGTITVDAGIVLGRFENLSNTGLIDINGGSSQFRTALTNNPYTFTNSGDIDVAPGSSLTFLREGIASSGNLIMESGSTLKGGGNINLINQLADLQGNLDIEDTTLSVTTSSINGAGSLIVGPSGTLNSTDSNWGAGVQTSGISSFSGIQNSTLGEFTNKAGANLTLQEGARVRIDDEDFTNEGDLFFSSGPGQTYFWEANTGSLGFFVNAPSGEVTVTGPGIRRFNNSVNNQGLIDLNTTTEFDNSGGVHLNSGTINAHSNFLVQLAESFSNQAAGSLNSTTGILDLTGNGSVTSTFANAGTITVDAGIILGRFENLSNTGLIDINGGNAQFRNAITNNPNTFTNSGAINVAPGASLTFLREGIASSGNLVMESGSSLSGGGDINLVNQVVDIQGPLDIQNSTLSATTSSISGIGTLIVGPTGTFNANNSNVDVAVEASGEFSFEGTTNTALGDFTNKLGSTLTIEDGARVRIDDENFTNEGDLFFAPGTGQSYFWESNTGSLGSFINAPNGEVTVAGPGIRRFNNSVNNQGLMNLNTTTEFDNSGGIHFNSGNINANSNLLVQVAESFTNQLGGNLNATAGILDLTGNSSATSTFDNAGTITVDTQAILGRFEDITNSGLIDINAGNSQIRTATINNPYTFTNTGIIDVAPGAVLTFLREGTSGLGNVVMASGSELKGGGDFSFSNQATDIQGILDIENSTLSATTSSLNGIGTIVVGSTGELNSADSNWGANVETSGTSSFSGTANSTLGAFSNQTGGNITLQEGARIRIDDNDFTNEGELFFATGTGQSYFWEANTGSLGSFVNAPSGEVTVDGSGIRRFMNSVNNQGLMNLNTVTEFDNSGGVHSNSGIINAEGNLLVETAESFSNLSGGHLNSLSGNLNLSGNASATSNFDNSGTITIASGALISRFENQINSGLIDINSGALVFQTARINNNHFFTNNGDIDVAPGAAVTFKLEASHGIGSLTFASGSTLKGGGEINLSSQVADIQGNLDIEDSQLSASTSSLNGAGTLMVGIEGELHSTDSNWGATVESSGTSTFTGNLNTAFGNFTNKTDGTLTIENGTRIRLDDENFINEGQLTFAPGTSQSYFWETNSGSLGSFINAPTGVVTVNGTGPRRFNNSCNNQGLIEVNSPLAIDNPSGTHTNSGIINAHSNFLVQSAESFSNSSAGELNSITEILDIGGNQSATSTFLNEGTITVADSALIRRFKQQSNTGLIDIVSGSMVIHTSIINNPYHFSNSGHIQVANGTSLTFSSEGSAIPGTASNDLNGLISGEGEISITTSTFTNHGTIAPGSSTGILTVGPMTHSPSATLEIEIANNTGPGTGHDQLVVNGNIALNGTLDLTRLNGFVPAPSDTFVIMTATGDITGNFSNINQSQPGNWTVTVDEATDQVSVTFTEDLIFDYTDFQNAYFSPSQITNGDADFYADFDGDGLANLLEWIHGFDPTSTSHPVAAIAIEQTATTLDLIYPESTLLPVGVYEADVLTNLGLASPFGLVPRADWTRIADTPIAGQPNIQLVTLRLNNANWNTAAERFFRFQFSPLLP